MGWRLTPKIREILKKPHGELIRGSLSETAEKIKLIVEREKPSMLISIGDVVSRNLLRRGLNPDLIVIDNKVMRRKIKPIDFSDRIVFRVRNPAGYLSDEAFEVVKKAISNTPSVLIVDGEEDLFGIPVVIYAPETALVVYGQPGEGVVVVRVSDSIRKIAENVINSMIRVSSM